MPGAGCATGNSANVCDLYASNIEFFSPLGQFYPFQLVGPALGTDYAGRKGDMTAFLTPGGGELAANALQANAVDKVTFFIAPKILGGRNSRPVVAGNDPQSLDDACALWHIATEKVGEDMLVTGYTKCLQDSSKT